jgi:hypothetical protein
LQDGERLTDLEEADELQFKMSTPDLLELRSMKVFMCPTVPALRPFSASAKTCQ